MVDTSKLPQNLEGTPLSLVGKLECLRCAAPYDRVELIYEWVRTGNLDIKEFTWLVESDALHIPTMEEADQECLMANIRLGWGNK